MPLSEPDFSCRLEPVRRADLGPLFKLRVADTQNDFVAPNEISLAQVHYETGATPYVIWAGEERVGFCQVIDMRRHQYREPEDDPEALFLWRLMVDRKSQGRGYGGAAMARLFELGRATGHRAMETSVVQSNAAGLKFYLGLGFEPTGRLVDGEVQLRRTL